VFVYVTIASFAGEVADDVVDVPTMTEIVLFTRLVELGTIDSPPVAVIMSAFVPAAMASEMATVVPGAYWIAAEH
jgi:hypothetical protein